jgi:hypothetical protein
MKNRHCRQSLWPPADQWIGVWGLLIIAVVGIVTTCVLDFFMRLTGMPWICCYFIGIGVAAVGVSLIFYAKLPLYRERRFFTFGPGALPEQRRPFYRWGYTCALLGALLLACLLLSRH